MKVREMLVVHTGDINAQYAAAYTINCRAAV